MASARFDDLVRLVQSRSIDRRRLAQSAAALGFSATAVGAAMARARPAVAQEGEPSLVTVSTEQHATWLRNFNPLLAQDSSRWPTQAGIYEPMIVHNTVTDEILPWLATGYEFSPDNTAITFTLREGVSWSDGQPFTSRDVKFTFDYLIQHEALAGTEGIRGALPFVAGVEAPDERTVVVTFNQV